MALFKRTKKDEKHKEEKKVSDAVAAPKISTSGVVGGAILYPHITEKSSMLAAFNAYVFRVENTATKIDIKRVIEKGYKVNVISVRVVNVRPKERHVGRTKGFRPGFKKAIVTLKQGQTIDVARA